MENLKDKMECKDAFRLERKYNPCVFPWRARYHTCSFCKREFKSAQALGGHMNVHRRDRARLRELQHSRFLDSSSVNFSACSTRSQNFLISSTKSDHLIISHHQEKKPNVMDSPLHDFLEHGHEKVASESELLKKDNPFVSLDFIVSLHQDSQEDLDLELRLGYPSPEV